MEGSEDQRNSSLTAKQRAEIEARQQQSKARRLDGNTGDAGPLFDEQDTLFQRDMFEPVATLTGDEWGAWEDIRQLGKKAEAWYRENLLRDGDPLTVTNDSTGWAIQFNTPGAKKSSGRKGEDIYRAIVALPQILEKDMLVSSEPDAKGRPDIKAVHKLSATVQIADRQINLIATIRETRDGKFHYDLSKDIDGGRSETALRQGEAKLRSSALEGAPTELNLDLADASVNSTGGEAITPAQARAINAAGRAELAHVGLLNKIGLKVEAGRLTGATGSYSRGVISILRNGSQGWRHTLDHEIVHALRDPARWGGTHGLFTAQEWQALVRAARASKAIRARVEAAYSDLDATGQAEEMVAELYADWAAGR